MYAALDLFSRRRLPGRHVRGDRHGCRSVAPAFRCLTTRRTSSSAAGREPRRCTRSRRRAVEDRGQIRSLCRPCRCRSRPLCAQARLAVRPSTRPAAKTRGPARVRGCRVRRYRRETPTVMRPACRWRRCDGSSDHRRMQTSVEVGIPASCFSPLGVPCVGPPSGRGVLGRTRSRAPRHKRGPEFKCRLLVPRL